MTKEEMLQLKTMIEAVVQPIKNDISSIRDDMDKRFDSVETQLTGVKEKVDAVDTRLRKLEISVENETNRAIKITMEGHAGLNQKMDTVLDVGNRVETLEHKMSTVEYYVKKQQTQ